MYKNPFVHGTLLIQSEVMKKIGLYDEDFKYSQDYKLYRDLLNKNYTIKIMYKKLYLLNMESNISSKHKEQQKKKQPRPTQRTGDPPRSIPGQLNRIWRRVGEVE